MVDLALSPPSPGQQQSHPLLLAKGVEEMILQIPPELEDQIFPLIHLSIRSMLEFTLPMLCCGERAADRKACFGKDAAHSMTEIMLMLLRRLPMPAPDMVRQLFKDGPRAWKDGY